MSFRGMMSWCGDRMNPIVVKELRQAVKSRFLIFSLLLLFLLQPIGLVMYILFQGPQATSPDWQGGREAFLVLQYILLAACLLFLPISVGWRLASERSDVNVDLMYITTLSPAKIITGKLTASFILAIMFFSACTPFMVFTYFLRGIDLFIIILVLLFDVVVVFGAVLLCLFLATVSRNRVVKAFLGLLGLAAIVAIYAYTAMGVYSMVIYMNSSVWYQPEFWITVCTSALVLFIFLGLLYTWSIAMVSAPSSNRTLATRLFVLSAWFISGTGLFVWGFFQPATIYPWMRDIPVVIWLQTTTFLFGLTLLMAFHEREEWGPRITRKIPKFFLFRGVAFLLYNGSAGGVLFSLLFFSLSVFGALLWDQTFSGTTIRSGYYGPEMIVEQFVRGVSVLFLYFYCYGMTALFIRRMLLTTLPAYFTWVILILLFVLFCIVPMLMGLAFFGFDIFSNDYFVWFLPHPWCAAYELGQMNYGSGYDYDYFEDYYLSGRAAVYIAFVVFWAAMVTLVNFGWLVKQLGGFRPFQSETRTEEPGQDVIPAVVEPTAS